MIRIMVLGVAVTTLAGCALRSTYLTTPVIDMHGVDQNKYNADLTECQTLKIQRTKDTIRTADVIPDCMRERGYKVMQDAG
jgi:hypothetical protein